MSRIAPEDMTTLFDKDTVNAVAATAVSELEEMQVAHCINEAANCGEYSTVYARPISKDLITKLMGQGYTITSPNPIARPGDVSVISWKSEE